MILKLILLLIEIQDFLNRHRNDFKREIHKIKLGMSNANLLGSCRKIKNFN